VSWAKVPRWSKPPSPHRTASLLLNLAHALDHLFLLIFATAVSAIATDFGIARWEALMPYSVGAFVMFGLGSLPAGKRGDSWGRRPRTLVFFFGLGASALRVSLTQTVWQLAAALTLLGPFTAIYHPVGIPMLVQGAKRSGATIGVNGLSGNLGIAAAALLSGFLVQAVGWRAAFAGSGVACIALGFVFARLVPAEAETSSRRSRPAAVVLSPAQLARVLVVMTVASASASLLFNLATNDNGAVLGVMILIFGAIAFNDAVSVRYVDDCMQSRVAGLRQTLLLGFSSMAVWALGPVVKANGFGVLRMAMAGISLCTAAALQALPFEDRPAAA
jgi:MFS family permease